MKIAYSHRSAQHADSIEAARANVRTALIQSYGSASAAEEMVEISTDDGIYCYASQADADRDDTGANAYALIEREGGRNAR
jgi:predicted outer membrane protein